MIIFNDVRKAEGTRDEIGEVNVKVKRRRLKLSFVRKSLGNKTRFVKAPYILLLSYSGCAYYTIYIYIYICIYMHSTIHACTHKSTPRRFLIRRRVITFFPRDCSEYSLFLRQRGLLLLCWPISPPIDGFISLKASPLLTRLLPCL